MAQDPFSKYRDRISDPVARVLILENQSPDYLGAAPPSLSDTEDLSKLSTCIFVSAAGTVRVTLGGQASGQYIEQSFPVGWHPLRAKRLWATGTTASVRAFAP